MMDALRFSFQDRTLDLNRIPIPTVEEPNEVVIQVAYAGICGTDLHILAGDFPCRQMANLTLGHEISGIIVEVGNDVINFQEGDKVVVNPNRGCKRCPYCHAGKPHFCKLGCATNTLGIYRDGGWAQYLVCPEEQVFKIKAPVTLEQAVLTEPLSCVLHGWEIIAPIPVGSKILLLGAGIAGTLWACILHLQGHRNVTISEPIVQRLERIRKISTGFKLITPDILRKESFSNPDDYQYDVVIDCSGSPAAIEQGISLLNSGGQFCLFGVASVNSKIEISPFDIFWKELKIKGAKLNPFTFHKAIGMVEALGSRYLNFNTLGIKTFPLSDYKLAIAALKEGIFAKIVFKM